MTRTELDWFLTRTATWLIVGAALVALAGWHGGIPTITHIQRPLPAHAPVSPDLAGEVWWTTTDCPAGVPVPCLDPTVDPSRVPAHVAAELEHLVAAQWQCLDQAGVAPGDVVWVSAELRVACRQYAYASLTCDPDTSCEALEAPGRERLPEDSDDPRYDCRVDGNRRCGPGNPQGVPAGDYSPGA